MRASSMLLLAVCLCGPSSAKADEDCPPLGRAAEAVAAAQTHAQADVTDRLSCQFPQGMTFNEAAIRLDEGGFEFPNPIERSFFRWNLRGEEFVARRSFRGPGSSAELLIVVHLTDGRIVRFAAHYAAGG